VDVCFLPVYFCLVENGLCFGFGADLDVGRRMVVEERGPNHFFFLAAKMDV